ncbi:helix-turn-helix domain-containing protein [Streptomyces xantholiticus]
MSTDYQQGRAALGARLRELRAATSLTGRAFADRLGWPQSKVSKLETGRQTASADDLRAWADAAERPDVADELVAQLGALESRQRTWRRQLAAGHRPVQDALTVEYERSAHLRAWQNHMVVGMLQTPDYARHVFAAYADLHQSPRDIDDAVRARIRRQALMYDTGRTWHVLMWEAALHTRIAPAAVMAGQLDRLVGTIGLDTIQLGIVPLGSRVAIPPGPGFWLYDERLAIVEDWHAELWLDDTESVAVYCKVWDLLHQAAVFGPAAHRLIARARAQLDTA